MDPTLQDSLKQYHPYKQQLLLQQSHIYQQSIFGQQDTLYEPTSGNVKYYQKKCLSQKRK